MNRKISEPIRIISDAMALLGFLCAIDNDGSRILKTVTFEIRKPSEPISKPDGGMYRVTKIAAAIDCIIDSRTGKFISANIPDEDGIKYLNLHGMYGKVKTIIPLL